MSLIKKQPGFKKGDFMRVSDVAELLCVDESTIRRGGVGRFTLIPLNDSQRAPLLISTLEVTRFIESRIEKATDEVKK